MISRFHNYLIYYEAHETEVSIERVLDGRRDVRRIREEPRNSRRVTCKLTQQSFGELRRAAFRLPGLATLTGIEPVPPP